MNLCFVLVIFIAEQLYEIRSQKSTIFTNVVNVDVSPAINYYKEMTSRSHLVCASFCLQDEACKGSVFTGDSCQLVSQFVLTSQLQYYSGHVFLSKYKCVPIWSGKAKDMGLVQLIERL